MSQFDKLKKIEEILEESYISYPLNWSERKLAKIREVIHVSPRSGSPAGNPWWEQDFIKEDCTDCINWHWTLNGCTLKKCQPECRVI